MNIIERNTVSLISKAALAFCLLTTPSGVVNAGSDDDDPPSTITRKSNPHPENQATANIAGIATAILQSGTQVPELLSNGTVLDLAPLLSIRQQYLDALTQHDGAQAKFRESELNLQRTRKLHDQEIVASRRVQEQQALWQADKANVNAASYQRQTILAASRLQWGEKLTEWFTQPGEQSIKGFLQGSRQLLGITLPPEMANQQAPGNIHVDIRGKRQQAIPAQLIGAAPQADPVNLGRRAFYQLESINLPVGAQLSVWLPDHRQANSAALVPDSAVIWHLGQAFVFLKSGKGEFIRHPLESSSVSRNGFWAVTSLHAGDEVVVSGAQTLLSEELKHLIPREDDD